MDATKSYNLISTIIKHKKIGLEEVEGSLRRLLLTSSKSFKYRVAQNNNMNLFLRKQLLALTMPKFIWVCELSNKDLMTSESANGLILLDATGKDSFSSIIFLYYPGQKIYVTLEGEITISKIDYGEFSIYKNNLKGEWNEWKAS